MSPRRSKTLKILAYSFVGAASLLGILLLTFRLALARAPEYRAQVQAWVSREANLQIEFARMDARLRYFGPELVFDQAIVHSRDGKRLLVRARRVSVGFDIWTAISTGRLAAGRITLEEPELQIVRMADGRIEIVGQRELPERDPKASFEPDDLPTGRLQVVGARVTVRDLKSGRTPWTIPNVSFDLQRSGGAMHLDGAVSLPISLGESLQFTADTEGKLAYAQALEWQFKVDARDLDLAGWAQMMPNDWLAPRKGRGSVQLSGSLRGARPRDVAMLVYFEKVALALPVWTLQTPSAPTLEIDPEHRAAPDLPAAAADSTPGEGDQIGTTAAASSDGQVTPQFITEEYSRIALGLRIEHSEDSSRDSWSVTLDDLHASRPSYEWRSKAIKLNIARSINGGLDVDATADLIRLQNLWPLLAYAKPTPQLMQLRALQAQGDVRDLQVKVARADASSPLIYNIDGKLQQVSVAPVSKAPGIRGFGGVFTADENGGQINLDVRDGAISIPRYFRTPLPANSIQGRLNWRREPDGWRVVAESVRIDSPDGKAQAAGLVFVPSDGTSAIVEVKATGTDLDARAAPRYMPAGKLSPAALAWLDRAFTAGRVPHAEFEMRGRTREFPFRNDQGLFVIRAHIEGLGLDYQPGWAPASELRIDAEFRNAGMTATVTAGTVAGLQLKSASGRIVDFKHSELLLDAEVTGDLAQALAYVQQSPVGPAIGSQFMALRGSGALEARTRVRLPFKNVDARRISVDSRLADCTIGLEGISEEATRVAGTVAIQDYAMRALNMRGAFLGGSFTATGGASERFFGRGAGMQIAAEGSARSIELAKLLKLPKAVSLSGALRWSLKAQQERHVPGSPAPRSAVIESTGAGLAVGLPAPLRKSAEEMRTLQINVEAPDDRRIFVRGAFGATRAFGRMVLEGDTWRFDRAGLRFDAQAAALPAHAGIRIEGDIEHFVLDDWLKLKGEATGGGSLADYLRAANARLGRFEFLGFEWRDVRALMQAEQRAWRVDVAGDEITGQLSIPYALDSGQALQIALNKLNVGEHRSEGAGGSADPRDVPAIHARIDELSLSGRPVGAARVVLEKQAQGVQLRSGELRADSFTATARGSWLQTNAGPVSALTLDVASTDVRETLRAFNFQDLITGKRANAHAALTWPGSIDADLLARASGTVRVELADGQLLQIEPGAGRMLGLMSIAALPRRLSLDFSDVTDKGFSFDAISGDFTLKDGDAYTDNLLVRGPAGETGIVGRTGLSRRDYDLTAVAAGDIGGSLSVAGTAVGGPVLGAAVLAFTRIFKEPLKGVTRRYYRIEGPWDNPIVERIDKDEAKQDALSVPPSSPPLTP